MTNPWYELMDAAAPLTQGDLLFRCPLLSWNPAASGKFGTNSETTALQQAVQAFQADVVVMTQACDLEHAKVRNVVLGPHISLADFRTLWESSMRHAGHNPTAKAWKSVCDDIADGYVWNQAFLNRSALDQMPMELRVVDFHEIFTIPRAFLESLLAQRQTSRLRLLPPYREHLSQAFARFFMRVGLPQPLDPNW